MSENIEAAKPDPYENKTIRLFIKSSWSMLQNKKNWLLKGDLTQPRSQGALTSYADHEAE